MVTIREASPADIVEIRTLFQEYAASLGTDLCFQGFAGELAALPGTYALPSGCLWLAAADANIVGCVAIRGLEADVCEMKRLYVRPEGRGQSVGRALAERAVAFAKAAGYRAVRLDTLSTMVAAQVIYRRMGFVDVPAYRFNPIEGAVFMELRLDDQRSDGGTPHAEAFPVS